MLLSSQWQCQLNLTVDMVSSIDGLNSVGFIKSSPNPFSVSECAEHGLQFHKNSLLYHFVKTFPAKTFPCGKKTTACYIVRLKEAMNIQFSSIKNTPFNGLYFLENQPSATFL